MILERVCEHDENVDGSWFRKMPGNSLPAEISLVFNHGSVPWDQLRQRITNTKLRTLLVFAVSPSLFFKQTTAC
jgi:hypothetical protein